MQQVGILNKFGRESLVGRISTGSSFYICIFVYILKYILYIYYFLLSLLSVFLYICAVYRQVVFSWPQSICFVTKCHKVSQSVAKCLVRFRNSVWGCHNPELNLYIYISRKFKVKGPAGNSSVDSYPFFRLRENKVI